MPGIYKEKNCKFCNKKYRKRGPYCSQSCASTDREPTERMREAMREVATDYNLTPEAIARQATVHTSLISLKADDYWVDIPNLDDDDDGYKL